MHRLGNAGIFAAIFFLWMASCNPVLAQQKTVDSSSVPEKLTKDQLDLISQLKKRQAKVRINKQTGKISLSFPGGFEIHTHQDDGEIKKRKDLKWQADAALMLRLNELPIESVSIQNGQFSAKEFRAICRLTKLQSLSINVISKDIEREAFVDVGNLKNLKSLNISSTHIDDDMLLRFTELKKLESLTLTHASVTAKSMKAVAKMPLLKAIDYSFTAYDREVMDTLFSMKQLTSLRMGGLHDRDRPGLLKARRYDLSGVQNLENLVSLRLHSVKITDETFEAIGKLRKIRLFGLWAVDLDDQQFAACLPALKPEKESKLVLEGLSASQITGASIDAMIDDRAFRKNSFYLPVELPFSVPREAAIRMKRAWPKAIIRHRRIERKDGVIRLVTDTIELPESDKSK